MNAQIFLINLDRSPERLDMQQKQFDERGLTFTRIPAVDGSTIDPSKEPGFDNLGYRRRHGKTPNANEIGCYLAHMRAIDAFMHCGAEFGIILEDDGALMDGFEDVIEALTAKPKLWDVVKLNRRHNGLPVRCAKLTDTHALVSYFSKQAGAVGYLLNRKAGARYQQKMLPMQVPYDHAFDRGHALGLNILGVVPPVVDHVLEMPTTIAYAPKDRVTEAPPQASRKLPFVKRFSTFAYRTNETVLRFARALLQIPFLLRS